MKKWMSISIAFLLGVIVTLSAGEVSAQVKSLIGQKVTGELTVVVNGKELADKGAVINGRTNAPVRALVDAVGGELSLDGKTINITTDAYPAPSSTNANSGSASKVNPYAGQPKESLDKIKAGLENDTLKVLKSERDEIKAGIEQLKTSSGGELTQKTIETAKKNLATYEANIEKYTKQLEQVNEALELLEK